MNKIEEIIDDIANINKDEDGNTIYYLWEVKKAMKEFGKLTFEAGRENKTKYNPTKDGKLYQMSVIPEYKTYEDFLKEIKDESNN